jgi:hypothetical protein
MQQQSHSAPVADIGPVALWDTRKVAAILGVCPGTVDNLRRRKLLEAVKNGSRVLFQPVEVARYIEASKEGRV